MKNKILWEPDHSEISQTHLSKFQSLISQKTGLRFSHYREFHKWSVDHNEEFWKEFLEFGEFVYNGNRDPVLKKGNQFYDSVWFENLEFNFAKNLLHKILQDLENGQDNIVIYSFRENLPNLEIKASELIQKVQNLQAAFLKNGLKKGDRVAVCLPNIPETVYIMLATTSLGGIFSSSSPDFGNSAIIDRFGQIQPKFFFGIDSYSYKGKRIQKIADIQEISKSIPGLEKTIFVSFDPNQPGKSDSILYLEDFAKENSSELVFASTKFTDPVYIMYSSGTTGLPKCMVQGNGVLLNHKKEHLLHLNLKTSEKILYFTTCGWMMWNWLVSALSVNAKIVLFEGNPFFPGPEILWDIIKNFKIEVFGTSAGYLSALEKTGFSISDTKEFSHLRTILSTGSVLLPEQFDYVYKKLSSRVQLSSISGGTDLNGCFVLGNPHLPVYRGEIQSAGLGMDVDIFNEESKTVMETEGELVCKKEFPSMPLFFWNDPENKKYHAAYFAKFPGVWRHGDYCSQTSEGGFIIAGRSDATLNPGGVRIGTADIYRIVEKIDGIMDSVAVGNTKNGIERILLFVKLKSDTIFDQSLEAKIKKELKEKASPRHVPELIFSVTDIPYTRNLKKVELVVKNILEGRPISNKESLSNPEILEIYYQIKESLN